MHDKLNSWATLLAMFNDIKAEVDLHTAEHEDDKLYGGNMISALKTNCGPYYSLTAQEVGHTFSEKQLRRISRENCVVVKHKICRCITIKASPKLKNKNPTPQFS
ncbi:hypothetical protein AB6A40_000130 [Gnathostoma spinigerum]|uniref:Uncharacterized protein n=1 Tax=Gnathostoma spinigerum TaxID=75299 RepID=A0ABD6E7S5_9BILA